MRNFCSDLKKHLFLLCSIKKRGYFKKDVGGFKSLVFSCFIVRQVFQGGMPLPFENLASTFSMTS